jgi:4-hydroxybenzoyl-CoA reductase subunit beta
LNPFAYLSPETLASAAREFLSGENTALIAGGTDLIPLLKSGLKHPARLLSLGRIGELQELSLRPEGLFVGAMVSLAAVMESPLVRKYIPVLAEGAQWVASPQIRNQGTVGGNLLQERRCHYFNQSESWRANIPACFALGGNICHQIPRAKACRAIYYSDLAPVLLAYDAAAEILDERGPGALSLQEMIHGRTTGTARKFLLRGVLIPHPPPGTWGKFFKAGVRSAIDFALADAAARYSPAGPARQKPRIRIVVGALSPEPFALEETAGKLAEAGAGLSRETAVAWALAEAEAKISPIRETAVSPGTKKQSLQILRRAVEDLLAVLPS